MRSFCSSLMAALVIVALFWGNCLSCPQVLLALTTHQPAHGCCKRGQKPANQCQNQGMQQFLKADPGTQAQAAPAAAAVPETVTVAAPAVPVWTPAVIGLAAHAPPDLLALHSSFRI